MIERIKLWLKWYNRVCVSRWKKSSGAGTLGSQNAVHPVFANDSSKEGPIWVMHGSHFCSEALIQGESGFFKEGIPPAWLLWSRPSGYIYIHTVTRKPAPTVEKEADLFSTESRCRTETSWCNQLRLSQQVLDTSLSQLKNYFQAATIIYWLFSPWKHFWSIECQHITKNYNKCSWHVPRAHGDISIIFCLTKRQKPQKYLV